MRDIVILLGAPGSGKGTTAGDVTKARPDFQHVSTGDMLRGALKAQTPVGMEAKQYMDAGELVPDEVVMKIVREHLKAGSDDARYLFDGFPRTMEQARLLDSFLDEEENGKVSYAFLMDVPRDVLVERIAGRLICRDCGAVFHRTNLPPKKEGVCDLCGGELYQRADDNRDTVLNRLDVYEKQTASLISYYEQHGVLRRVQSVDRDAILAFILDKLGTPTQPV